MKRKQERRAESRKKARIENPTESLSPEERIKINTTPLFNMPYKEQVINLSFEWLLLKIFITNITLCLFLS